MLQRPEAVKIRFRQMHALSVSTCGTWIVVPVKPEEDIGSPRTEIQVLTFPRIWGEAFSFSASFTLPPGWRRKQIRRHNDLQTVVSECSQHTLPEYCKASCSAFMDLLTIS